MIGFTAAMGLVLFAAPQEPAEKSEAINVLRSMEERIAKARSVQARISSQRAVEVVEPDAKPRTNLVEILLEFVLEGDAKGRVSWRTTEKTDGTTEELTLIVDRGKFRAMNIKPEGPASDEWTTEDAPAGWRKDLVAGVALGRMSGLVFPSFFHPSGLGRGKPKFTGVRVAVAAAPRKAGFDGSERVGDRECSVIKYEWLDRFAEKEVPVEGRVWIDAKTGLPAKRSHRYTLDLAGRRLNIVEVETFESFKLDEPVDAKAFEVPSGK